MIARGQPFVNSAGFGLPEQLTPTAQLAILRAAQDQVRSQRLLLAQQRTALLMSEEEQSDLRRDVTALQLWAAESLASFGDDDAPPISLPDVPRRARRSVARAVTRLRRMWFAVDAASLETVAARFASFGPFQRGAKLFLGVKNDRCRP